MVLGDPIDQVLERDDPAGGYDAGVTHAPADEPSA